MLDTTTIVSVSYSVVRHPKRTRTQVLYLNTYIKAQQLPAFVFYFNQLPRIVP